MSFHKLICLTNFIGRLSTHKLLRHNSPAVNIFCNQFTSGLKSVVPQSTRSKSIRDEKYRVSDKISENYQLIYNAPMASYFLASNIISTITTIIVGGLTIATYTQDDWFVSEAEIFGLMTSSSDLVIFLISFAIFNLAIRRMIHIYPLRIYRSKSKYIAVFESQMPLTKRHLEFVKGQLEVLPPKGIMPWRDARYKMKDQTTLLLVDYFKSSSELYNMLKKNIS